MAEVGVSEVGPEPVVTSEGKVKGIPPTEAMKRDQSSRSSDTSETSSQSDDKSQRQSSEDSKKVCVVECVYVSWAT